MGGKQIFAKIAVFILIAINLGAYYVFWPTRSANPFAAEVPGKSSVKHDEADASEAPRPPLDPLPPSAGSEPDGNQQPPPLPPQTPAAASGKEAPPKLAAFDAPLKPADADSKPVVPTPEAGTTGTKADPIALTAVDPKATKADPPAPGSADEQRDILASLRKQVQPATPPVPSEAANPPAMPAQNPPLAGGESLRVENSPWSVQMEIAQGRTLLKARQSGRFEFRIVCDHVEMKAPEGALLAVGKVTLEGPGMSANCGKLTLPLAGDKLILDGQAEVRVQGRTGRGATVEDTAALAVNLVSPAGWEMRGDHLALNLVQAPADTPPAVQPTAATNLSPADPAAPPARLP